MDTIFRAKRFLADHDGSHDSCQRYIASVLPIIVSSRYWEEGTGELPSSLAQVGKIVLQLLAQFRTMGGGSVVQT